MFTKLLFRVQIGVRAQMPRIRMNICENPLKMAITLKRKGGITSKLNPAYRVGYKKQVYKI